MISCAHILIICRMSYFLASKRLAVFVAAQAADADERRLDTLLVFIKTDFAKGAPVKSADEPAGVQASPLAARSVHSLHMLRAKIF